MRTLLTTFAAAGALALAAAAATPAAAVDFIDGHYTIDAHGPGDGDGLEIKTQRSYAGGNLPTFSLDVGDSWGANDLFKIWTEESDVALGEDTVPQEIKFNFSFSSPVIDGTATGATGGEYSWALIGWYENGYLDWANDGVFNFAFGSGGTGNLQLTLTDADFNKGWLGLDGGKKHGDIVQGTFTLTAAAVPEPGTWALMITGFGLAGAALRRQRKLAMTAA